MHLNVFYSIKERIDNIKTEIIFKDAQKKNTNKELPNLCCIKIKCNGLYYLISKHFQGENKVVLISLNDNSNGHTGTSIVDLYTVNAVLELISDGAWEIVDSKIII